MAFFKFRKGADASPRAPAQPQSIEAIRQRAKYRLTGATVLVLVGVIGLPMLFDKQPRPIAVDTPISIPDRNKVQPLALPGAPASTPAVVVAAPDKLPGPAPELQTKVTPTADPDKTDAPKPPPVQADKGSAATDAPGKATAPVVKSAASAAAPKPDVAKPEVNRAQALLDGKAVEAKAAAKTPAAESRFVVQVGAFADNARAQEVRMKLERAGLKTYAQTADTKDGRRIRVRLGPFATRAEAEKAVDKVKKLNLPASLLTL